MSMADFCATPNTKDLTETAVCMSGWRSLVGVVWCHVETLLPAKHNEAKNISAVKCDTVTFPVDLMYLGIMVTFGVYLKYDSGDIGDDMHRRKV